MSETNSALRLFDVRREIGIEGGTKKVSVELMGAEVDAKDVLIYPCLRAMLDVCSKGRSGSTRPGKQQIAGLRGEAVREFALEVVVRRRV
jgi:hypothetical protein